MAHHAIHANVATPGGIASPTPGRVAAAGLAPRRLGAALLLAAAAALCGCAKTPVPTDPDTSRCSIQAPEFAGWFQPSSVTGGTVKLNGIANPANSLTFSDSPNCDFYKWSEQMFLWLTSPAPTAYGGSGRVFQSQVFYDVSPLDASFDRTLVPHTAGVFPNLSLRAAKVGAHGLQVVRDRSGVSLDVEPPRFGPTGRQLILDQSGKEVEIGRAVLEANGQPTFLDTKGRRIEKPRPLIGRERDQALTVQKFIVSAQRRPIFLNVAGTLVDVENGEADGSILMAQTGSLVYSSMHVNDVFAVFLTGQKNGQLPSATQFPTTAAEITQITNYAATHGITIPDPEAMAVEVKMTWVEAQGLPDPSKYITIMATIPAYSANSTNTEWTRTGQKTVKMALVGVHVVGFTAGLPGHPEGIWATFEHESNAPALTYDYRSTSGVKTVNPDFSKAWLFSAASPPAGSMFNEPHMQQDPLNTDNIQAIGTFQITPSNTMRVEAWGAAANASPNPLDPTPADSNSELISINNGVRGLLDSADPRARMIMTSNTWTIQGGGPSSNFGNPGNAAIVAGRAVGTSQMANTTAETYQQPPFALPFTSSFSKFNNNCFSCHTTNTTSVSHIYSTPGHPGHGTKPLFP